MKHFPLPVGRSVPVELTRTGSTPTDGSAELLYSKGATRFNNERQACENVMPRLSTRQSA